MYFIISTPFKKEIEFSGKYFMAQALNFNVVGFLIFYLFFFFKPYLLCRCRRWPPARMFGPAWACQLWADSLRPTLLQLILLQFLLCQLHQAFAEETTGLVDQVKATEGVKTMWCVVVDTGVGSEFPFRF